MRRTLGTCLCAGLMLVLCNASVSAAISASATVSSQQLGPDSYEYSVNLNNTGDTKISTLWFGWVVSGPYIYDLLPSVPTSVAAPAGWQGMGLSDSPFGYYSVRWTSPTGLAAGQSLSGLVFDSPDPPSVVNGTSWFAGYPARQSWVYIGASQADPGYSFVPTVLVPEPAMSLCAPIALLLLRRRRS